MKRFGFLIALLGALVFALAIPGAVYGAPPSNDNFASATVVTNLPFTDTVANIAEATAESGEPGACTMGDHNVWYSFTPTENGVIKASATATFYYTSLRIFKADGLGMDGLTWVGCQSLGQSIAFAVQAGTTYYLQAGNFLSSIAVYPWDTLTVDLSLVPPPANDDFANAASITTLPFTESVDITGATTQPGEPSELCGGNLWKTIWYSFTPTTSGMYSAALSGGTQGGVNVFAGATLDSLTRVACGSSSTGSGAFHADAGTTYYLQAGTWMSSGSIATWLEVTPPPAVGFIWGPSYPSRFDIITFQGIYLDPIGIDSWTWSFGDGVTATGQYPQHQYAQDGDYSVTVTATTPDGRTNSETQVIHVRTPDTPPEITVPADITVNATSPAGANVTFTVTATDENPSNPLVTCTPPSGSVFKIGDTQVVCSATDAAGLTSTKSFNVHVKGAPEQVADLMALVDSYNLGLLGTALHEKLVKIQGFLAANKPKRACEVLDRFLAQVKEQRGKRISIERADRLMADARRIKAVIGC